MRVLVFLLAGWLLLMSSGATKLCAAEVEQVVTLVGDPWPPYFLGELGQEASGGVGVELMQAIFERLEGVRLSVPMVPWKRALQEVEQGTKDGIGILLKTPEREVFMDYTVAVFTSYNKAWYESRRFPEGFAWEGYDKLGPYVIGVVRGHSYGAALDLAKAEGTVSVIEVSSVDQLFAMLVKSRIDLAVADHLVGDALERKYAGSGDGLRSTERIDTGGAYHIAFSKKSEARHLIPAIDRVVLELQSSGLIEELVSCDRCRRGPPHADVD